ncbi:MAG: hypothetical protein QXV37_00680, partial [Candidatus Jordarchaeaceae archaeon]
MTEIEKREELKNALRRAVALLGDVSEKIKELTSTLSSALAMVGYREETMVSEVAEAKSSAPISVTFQKKEERVAEVSSVVARPIESKFKALEELVPEGTHIKAMCTELENLRDWVMGLSPMQSSILYQINQWCRKLKNYPHPKLTEQDSGELRFLIHEWKV